MDHDLKTLRKASNLTQGRLAELIGTTHATVQRIEAGQIPLTLEWARKLAPHLGVHAANLLFDIEDLIAAEQISENVAIPVSVDFERLPIIGQVEAGNYRSAEPWPEDDWASVTLPIETRRPYKGHKRFCLEVRGTSMNMEFEPGSLVICISMMDLHEEPQDGAIYVVDHLHATGDIDSTLKELRLEIDGRAFLWPRSSDPAHQAPIEFNGNADDTITLRAKVVGDYSIR